MTSLEFRDSLRETSAPGRGFRSHALLVLLIGVFVASLSVTVAWGQIPEAERTVLLNIYKYTNGAGWDHSEGWNGSPGTECTWYGITCDAEQNHVIIVFLYFNNLRGTLPCFADLTNLEEFTAAYNQLTGTIPPLNGLTNLKILNLSTNQLRGPIPSLSGLVNLEFIRVGVNFLSGDVPDVPNPSSLDPGYSMLCPNNLNQTSNTAWDEATGMTESRHWYDNCTTALPPFSVVYDSNCCTGGYPPVDSSTYLSGQMVTVLGNTGALYKTDNSFLGWNTVASGDGGTSYVGGDTFTMGSADKILYAQWTVSSGLPVRIETSGDYPDIPSAYNAALSGETIKVKDGLGSPNPLIFDNPNNLNPFYVILRGGYDSTFTTDTGATLVIGGIEISKGSIEIGKIIIQ